jgi:hypothetical protein
MFPVGSCNTAQEDHGRVNVRVNEKIIRRELDRLARKVEAAWKEHEKKPSHGDEPFTCPGIGSIGRCTNTAVYLADKLGGVVYGYAIEDNPEAEVGATEGGHDFAMIDDRWLVDFWAKDTYQLPDLYDITKPSDKKLVRKRYGDVLKWERMSPENFAYCKEQLKAE